MKKRILAVLISLIFSLTHNFAEAQCGTFPMSIFVPTLTCAAPTGTIVITTTVSPVTCIWAGPGIVSGGNTLSPEVNVGGIYSYTITDTSNGCSVSHPGFLVGSPISVNYPTLSCSTTTAVMTANPSFTATSYLWAGPGIASGNTTKTITVNAPGYYICTVSNTVTGCQVSGSGSVGSNTFVPPITINNNTITCAYPTVDLIASSPSFSPSLLNFSWQGPGIVSGSTTQTINVNASGVYTCNVTNTLNGCVSSITATVSSNMTAPAILVTGSTFNCSGQNITLTASGASTYTWNPGGSTGNSISVSPTVTTTYSITGASPSCTNTGIGTFTVSAFLTPTIMASASPTLICAGNVATLTATGASTYSWMPGWLGGGSVAVSPTVTTSYTVTGTGANGCSGTKTISVVIATSPTVMAAANPSVLCSGSSSTITASGAVSYTWTPGAISNNSIVVSPTVSTIYTVTGSGANGCTAKKTLLITMDNFSTLTSGSPITCINSTTTYTAIGASSYTWSGPGIVSGANSSVVTINSGGNYTVVGNKSGCLITKVISVTANTVSPVLLMNPVSATICAGSNVIISVSSSSAAGLVTYLWNNSASTKSISVNPISTSVYTVTVTYTSNGCSSSGSSTINVNSAAAPSVSMSVSNSLTCSTTTAQVFAANSSSNNATYSWTGPGLVSGNGTKTITVNMPGTYSCTVTDMVTGCSTVGYQSVFQSSSQLTLNLITNNPTCAGLCNGTATINVCGGAPGYTVYVSNSSNGYVNTSYMLSPGNYIINGLCASGTQYIVTVEDANSNQVMGGFNMSNPANIAILGTSSYSVCQGSCVNINPTVFGGNPPYSYIWSPTAATTLSNSVCPLVATAYTLTAIDSYSCSSTKTISVAVNPTPTITITNTTICNGSSFSINTFGANTYTWSNGATTSSITESPTVITTYSVIAKSSANCISSKTYTVTVDNTCQDVWPGDANSDGMADNLDVLELGLHYTQTGTSRATTSNSWQSYFSTNWTGTITSGKNLNHSDCNGDGTINDDDTLAIYNNYGLTHTFKPAQTTTVNPQLSIVPDQIAVAKGTWGTASVYLGDATTNINNINGVAFTVDFDNTLIDLNSIYIEYQPSFINASQNLHFRKLDFVNGKIFTATTHTINNNVSGFGKIATLHYQILSSLATDQVLNIDLLQANQSEASGLITPLTTGTGTLMAIGASVGLLESLNNNSISISPNPTNGLLTINSKTDLEKIEVVTISGQVLLSEIPASTNHTLHLENFANGIYFVNMYQNNRIIKREKVVLNK